MRARGVQVAALGKLIFSRFDLISMSRKLFRQRLLAGQRGGNPIDKRCFAGGQFGKLSLVLLDRFL